jgi:hypothetical protein
MLDITTGLKYHGVPYDDMIRNSFDYGNHDFRSGAFSIRNLEGGGERIRNGFKDRSRD